MRLAEVLSCPDDCFALAAGSPTAPRLENEGFVRVDRREIHLKGRAND